MNIIPRGDDKSFLLTIKDENALALDISTLAGLLVFVKSKKNGTILNKYSLIAAEGYDEIIIVDEPEGKVRIILSHEKTAVAELDHYYIEIIIQQTDTDFPDDIKNSTGVQYLCTFTKSRTELIQYP